MIEHHDVSVIDGKAKCACGFTFVSKDHDWAGRWAHAHIANPDATAAQLYEFVRAEKQETK